MPIDTSKTAMQVEGSDGLERLKQKVIESGPAPLYQGALASAAATAAGHLYVHIFFCIFYPQHILFAQLLFFFHDSVHGFSPTIT